MSLLFAKVASIVTIFLIGLGGYTLALIMKPKSEHKHDHSENVQKHDHCENGHKHDHCENGHKHDHSENHDHVHDHKHNHSGHGHCCHSHNHKDKKKFSLVPKIFRDQHFVLEFFQALSAGVMLALGSVHILVESQYRVATESACCGKYGMSELFAFSTFVFLFVLDKTAQLIVESKTIIDHFEKPQEIELHSATCDHDHNHGGFAIKSGEGKIAEVRAIMLMLAINFHALMEGLVIGSSGKEKTIWMTFFAICIHKIFEAFAVGSAVIKQVEIPKLRFWVYGMIFSLCTPSGILFGMLFSDDEKASGSSKSNHHHHHDSSVASRLCSSIAAGTLIWVAVMEFLPHAFSQRAHKYINSDKTLKEVKAERRTILKQFLVKSAAFVLGFANICVLILYV
jgi:zinc transporter ZupT